MPDSHNTIDQSKDTLTGSMTNSKPVPNPTQSKMKNVRKPVKQNAESRKHVFNSTNDNT